jgi:aerobic carbon-monoxide dehydrogenase large subunit
MLATSIQRLSPHAPAPPLRATVLVRSGTRPRTGSPDSASPARTLLVYLLPTAADLPPVTLLETVTPNPNPPVGAKGAGVAGCIGTPPVVVNAVCDVLDMDHIDMPLTPDAVWSALSR